MIGEKKKSVEIEKSVIIERMIELNYELLQAIRKDDERRVKMIYYYIESWIKLYLKE